jgi:hypothetical protein
MDCRWRRRQQQTTTLIFFKKKNKNKTHNILHLLSRVATTLEKTNGKTSTFKKKMAEKHPTLALADRLTDMFVGRLGFVFALMLGFGQAAMLSRSGDFLRVMGIAMGVAIGGVVAERWAARRETVSVFVLAYQFARRLATYAQYFGASLAASLLMLKFAQQDTRSSTTAVASASVFGFVTFPVASRIRLGPAAHDATTEFFVISLVYTSVFVIVAVVPLLYQWHFNIAGRRCSDGCFNGGEKLFYSTVDVVPPWHLARPLFFPATSTTTPATTSQTPKPA